MQFPRAVRLYSVAAVFSAVALVVPESQMFCRQIPAGEVDRKVDSLLRVMTLEEKLGQLNQESAAWNAKTGEAASAEQKTKVTRGQIGSFLNVYGAEATRALQKVAVEQSRLKIPLIFGLDVIHGFRTVFPIPLAEASSWDPELVERSARIAATEAGAAGVHWTFAPMVDIARDARWGRIAEGSGEDPYLGSMMAMARVRGFQGNSVSPQSPLLACAKHFAAYGGAEAGRDYNTVDMSERTLREIYLPPFKAAVDAGVGSLMSSFNEISGIPSSANRKLLMDILRGEWEFKGFVVSDWTAIAELQQHGVAANRDEAGLLAITAGVDMDMVSGIYLEEMLAAIGRGRLSEKTINESVRRVLTMKLRLGLFDNPYRSGDPALEKKFLHSREHRELAREVAQKSIVLLKNENSILPLSKQIRSIAVVGPLSNDKENLLGPWHAAGKAEDVVPVLEGIKNKVSAQTKVVNVQGCGIADTSTGGIPEARKAAQSADAVIIVAGEEAGMSGEASSRSTLGLPGIQERLVQAMVETGKPVILVLMNGRPLSIPWEAQHVPSIVESWFLGVEGGNAIADVLFGDANPGGKLPACFPRAVGQEPLYYNHKNTGRPPSQEKYTSNYLDVLPSPLYPFGYGLSFTTFKFGDLRLSARKITPKGVLTVTVSVKNTGPRDGDEVVQLYIRDEVASVTRPVKELKGFRRVSIKAGEAKLVEFTLKPEQLEFYDREMRFVVEPGMFKVFVGPNSEEVLEDEFEITSD